MSGTWDDYDSWDAFDSWEPGVAGDLLFELPIALDQDHSWDDQLSWDSFTTWDDTPSGQTLVYIDPAIDLGFVVPVQASVSYAADGFTTIEQRSSVDGVNWSDWATPGAVTVCRFVQVRATVAGDFPVLQNLRVTLSATRVERTLTAFNTATVGGARRIGIGDVRLPVNGFYDIDLVVPTLRNVGAGWTVDVADLDVAQGPRLRIFNAAGAPADAVADILIRGH